MRSTLVNPSAIVIEALKGNKKMLTLKESDCEIENDESQEDCQDTENENEIKKSKVRITGDEILRTALLAVQADKDDSDEDVSPETSSGKDICTGTSADTQWESLQTEEQMSYVANGKEFIIITRLEPIENETLLTSKPLKLPEDPPVPKGTKNRHRSKRHNKMLLLRKLIPNHNDTESLQEGDVNTSKDTKEERIPNLEEVNDSTLNDTLSQDSDEYPNPKDAVNWLKSCRPLPLYYTERGKPYLKCPACGAMFFTSSHFQKHLFTHMYKNKDTYICSFCTYSHDEPGMIFAHLSKHQDQCEFCNENLMRKNNFERHWYMCSSSFCIKRDRRGRFVCRACKLMFDLLPQLEKHWFKHSCKKERTHQCKECGGLYESKETLDNHICLKCPICGEIYDNLHRLKAHTMWTKHNLKCLICSYEFILTMDHEKHLAMHREVYRPTKGYTHCLQSADGKTYQCNLCDKIFYALQPLILHLQEDHGVENVRKETDTQKTVEEQNNEKENKSENPTEDSTAYTNINTDATQLNDNDFDGVL